MKSLLVTASLFLASLFPGPHATKPFPVMPATSPDTTIAENETHALPAPAVTSPALPSLPIDTDINRPQRASPEISTATNAYVTQNELAAVASSLRSLVYALAASSTRTAIPEYIAASGNPENPYAANSAIDQLNGTTLTNVIINSVSGLTVADIPSLSGTYLPLAGGTLSGDLQLPNATSTNFFATTASSTNIFASIANLANATINSLTLTKPLTVANGGTGWNTINSGSLLFGNGSSALATSSSLFWDSINSRLGIGTTSPAASLELFGSNSSTNLVTGGGIFEAITNADQTAGNFDSLSYREVNSVGAEVTGTRISGVFNSHAAGAESADLAFLTRNAGTLSEKMRILGNGNVGIGTSSPSQTLSVAGSGAFPLTIDSTGATTTLQFTNSDTSEGYIGYTKLGSGGLAFLNGAGATANLLVTNAGNVGINTTNPIDLLHIPGLANPIEASSTSTGLNNPYSLYVQGRYAYVASPNNNSLVIFDISNPAAPVEISSISAGSGSHPHSVYVQGRYAYVTGENNNTFIIIDVSNPALPVVTSILSLNHPFGVYIQGRYAYVTTYTTNTLAILDISNPYSPIQVGTVSTGMSQPQSVYVQGRYAYVASELNGSLVIFDVSNPALPVEVSTISTGLANPFFVYVQGRYAYVAEQGNSSLVIFDISNPTSPVELSSISAGLSGPRSVYVSGRYAYVASTNNNSLVTFDISNPASPIEVGSTSTGLNNPYNVYVQGRYAYVASLLNNSLVTFNIGGAYIQSIEAGTLQAASLSLDNNLQALDGAFEGGLTVGNNVSVGGSFDLTASTFNATTTQNYSIFSINTASSTKPLLTTLYNGNIGIGTATPYARLSVWGPDAASSTLAFNVVSSASSTVFAVFDGGNAQLSGTLTQSSDQRLKTNIQSLDASSTLALIDQLNPVTFNWIDPNQDQTPQMGFIAQQVQQIFPNLVSTTSPTALTPDGTLGVNYIGFVAPIIKSVQALYADVASLTATVAGFAQSFTSNTILASQELCVGSTCVTPAQFQAMVAATGQSNAGADPDSLNVSSSTPPIIQVNGDNPAIINVGDTYSDLGATITGPTPDINLGINTFVGSTPISEAVIDTSEPATYHIYYVATDQNGLTSTSTRTVVVQALNSQATSTDATTTDPQ
jgi:hypothetical protein